MAKIKTRTDKQISIGSSSGMPRYIGARAVVDRTGNGVRITLTDYQGTTQETVYEAIENIIKNVDTSLTFIMPDGRTFTTDPLKGDQGIQGEKGDTGDTGVGIESISLTGTSGREKTYTITFTDETTFDFIVTDGEKGDQGDQGEKGDTGEQGIQGVKGDTGNGILSIAKTSSVGLVDTYTITFTDGTTTTFQVTNGANGSGSVADVWQNGVSVLDGDTAKVIVPTKTSDIINDSSFITSPNVVYCTCNTAQGTAAKVATIVSGSLDSLEAGDQAIVKFTDANTASNPTLKIGSLTAKSIKRYGTTAPSTSAKTSWQAGSAISFVFDGSYWQMCDWNNIDTTYSSMTVAEYEAGTGTTARTITPARLKGAIQYWSPDSLSDLTNDMTVSDFTNDAGYLTSHQDISGKADKVDTDLDSSITTLFANLGWTQPT